MRLTFLMFPTRLAFEKRWLCIGFMMEENAGYDVILNIIWFSAIWTKDRFYITWTQGGRYRESLLHSIRGFSACKQCYNINSKQANGNFTPPPKNWSSVVFKPYFGIIMFSAKITYKNLQWFSNFLMIDFRLLWSLMSDPFVEAYSQLGIICEFTMVTFKVLFLHLL